MESPTGRSKSRFLYWPYGSKWRDAHTNESVAFAGPEMSYTELELRLLALYNQMDCFYELQAKESPP